MKKLLTLTILCFSLLSVAAQKEAPAGTNVIRCDFPGKDSAFIVGHCMKVLTTTGYSFVANSSRDEIKTLPRNINGLIITLTIDIQFGRVVLAGTYAVSTSSTTTGTITQGGAMGSQQLRSWAYMHMVASYLSDKRIYLQQ